MRDFHALLERAILSAFLVPAHLLQGDHMNPSSGDVCWFIMDNELIKGRVVSASRELAMIHYQDEQGRTILTSERHGDLYPSEHEAALAWSRQLQEEIASLALLLRTALDALS